MNTQISRFIQVDKIHAVLQKTAIIFKICNDRSVYAYKLLEI